MDWEAILEALTLGAGGGLSAYSQARQREEERAERERVRQEEARYRQQLLDMRQRENERAEARDRASERASMAAAGYRMARDDEPTGPMMFQPRGVEIQEFDFAPTSFAPPAPDVEEGRIRGTGAAAAPGQTYSAVARALEEEKPTVRTRTVEGPDIELPSAERRGFETIEGAYGSYLRPDKELLAQVERERTAREEEAKRLQDLADEMAAEERQLQSQKELYSYQSDLIRERQLELLRAREAESAEIQAAIQEEAPDLDPQDVRAIFSDYTQWLAKGREPGLDEMDARTEYNEFEKAAYLRQLINAFRSIKSGEVQDPYGGPFIQLGVPATRAPMLPGYTQPGLASPMDEFQRMYEEEQAAIQAGGF